MKEQFEALCKAAKTVYGDEPDCDDILDIIPSALKAFLRYVETVDALEIYRLVPLESNPEIYRNTVQEMDKTRHNAHEAAIISCKMVNRLCAAVELTPICPETEDRVEIGNFCCTVVADLFAKRVL